jgi:two-component system response regulator HydG
MSSPLILIIDDKVNIGEVISGILGVAGYTVVTATSGKEGLRLFREHSPALVLTDLRMEGMSGIDVIHEIRSTDVETPIILLTAHGTISSAVEAMKAGADDYLTKPLDYDMLRVKIEKNLQASEYRRENVRLREEKSLRDAMDDLIGRSETMKRVYSFIETVAPTESTVLIQGEPGTGKELIARSIHRRSSRSGGPYVVVDCAAIPEGLIESELFGYEKGAFTGATTRKPGRIEQADGGTVFLDEIGELPLGVQAKLLRLVQERQLFPIGAARAVTVDFRLIAATNRNLRQEVEEKRFRADLFYRLNVIAVDSPPLRERREDIPILAEAFWRMSIVANRLPERPIEPAHLASMMQYDWPGNVRELKNCIERLAILGTLPSEVGSESPRAPVGSEKTLSNVERQLVEDALRLADGNVSRAAQALGIGRKALYNRIKKYSIDVP